MVTIDFPSEDIAALQELQKHPHHSIRIKAWVLLLKSQDIPHHKIAKIAGVCENTIRSYFSIYKENGVKGLEELNFYKPQKNYLPLKRK